MKVAITGGIGSGKSSVLKIIQDLGEKTISCDEINKELLCTKKYILEIQKFFPTAIKNEKIDKKILAELIFKSKSNVDIINSLAHPIIRQNIKNATKNMDLVFVEVPLLFESNMQDDFDKIILVTADLDKRISRAALRDNAKKSDIEQRIKYQISNYNLTCIDYIITNDEDIKNLESQVMECICNIKERNF